jgi:uncharacterized protein
MRILAVSDEVTNAIYNPEAKALLGEIDLLLSCGDLPYTYLEYIVTQFEAPHAFYVHGNHDDAEYLESGRILLAPGGWRNLDRRVVKANDVLIAGLEGSIRYKPEAAYQYTQSRMWRRALQLMPRFLFNRIFFGRYVDIFIAHSPPAGIHDGQDRAHRGFQAFVWLMRTFRPRLFLHGHKHYYGASAWRSCFEATDVINVHPFRVIEFNQDEITCGGFSRR